MNSRGIMKKLKIGTRKSKLALWQAETVQGLLKSHGVECTLVEIESFGDQVQDIPLHKLGDKGVFTKALDEALLSGQIDLAVHSLKDVPTDLHPGLELAAVPERANSKDVLVRPLNAAGETGQRIIATGSIRRRAFWLNKYPDDKLVNLRGNVPTRIQKTDDNGWFGAVFAYAGLERLGLDNRISEVLDWMIPAPAQGAMGIVTAKGSAIIPVLQKIEDADSRLCVDVERSFMNELEAGCSSPLGAHAEIRDGKLFFNGAVLSHDGAQKMDISESFPAGEVTPEHGRRIAGELKALGALDLMNRENGDD